MKKSERALDMSCCNINRRSFLADCGMGFTGLVLGAMLHNDGTARADSSEIWKPPDGRLHFPAKAKSVIWLFMIGGTSHVETFDPKAALNQYAGKTIVETPYKDVLESPYVKKNLRAPADQHTRSFFTGLYPENRSMPMLACYLGYFGLMFLVLRWWKTAEPTRAACKSAQ